jgi:hypothetical protein
MPVMMTPMAFLPAYLAADLKRTSTEGCAGHQRAVLDLQ